MGKSRKDTARKKAKDNLLKMPGKDGDANSELANAEGDALKKEEYKGAKKALRHAVKAEVKKASMTLAGKLMEKATGGDLLGAEMVISLMEKKKKDGEEGGKKKKKQKGASIAQLLVLEKELEERKAAEAMAEKAAGND